MNARNREEALRRIRKWDGGTLDLDGLELTEIPEQVYDLEELSRLVLSNNHLYEFPPEIFNLSKLTHIRAEFNNIKSIPADIGKLLNLHQLSLFGNKIGKIPIEIGRLSNLKSLNLGNNEITEIPDIFSGLVSLEDLFLHHNEIRELSPKIGRISSLRQFAISDNLLLSVPREIGELTSLVTLYLDRNHIKSIPHEIGNLKHLDQLYIGDNDLLSIPNEICNLTSLKILDFSLNKISSIPAEIGKLSNLKVLNINDNHITELRPEIGRLLELVEFRFANNQLPQEILNLDGSGKNITRYLREDSAPLREIKLVFVGPPDIGKSCLLRHLQGMKFDPDNKTTVAFDVVREKLSLGTDEEDLIQANCWDFGGQRKYEITHQFFFNKESVYVVAWKPRQDLASLRTWLELIQNRAGKEAPIFVVATRRDELDHIPTPNQDELKKEFPGIRQFYSVTNLDEVPSDLADMAEAESIRLAIEESRDQFRRLKTDLYEAGKQQMIQRFPIKRREARAEIRGLEETALSLKGCKALFERHIDSDLTDELLRQLDAIGDIVYHSSADENSLVVLQPQWLGKAIGIAMGDARLQPGNGKVNHSVLVDVWEDHAREQGYCPEHYPYFLWLMERFELSYRLNKHQSLIPQLIQTERPTVPFTPETPFTLHPQCAYQWEVKGMNPPKGMLSILTAALDSHRGTSEEQMNWTNGMFITASEGQRVYIDLKDRVLTLAVRSEYPAFLTERIGNSVTNVLAKTWPGVNFELRYPCGNCLIAGNVPLGGFSTKLFDHKDPDYEIVCLSCGHESTVRELKEGYQLNLKLILDRLEKAEKEQAEMASIIQDAVLSLANHPNRILLTEGHATWRDIGQDVHALSVYCDHPDHKEPVAVYPVKLPQKWLKITQSVMRWTGLVAKGLGLVGPSLQFMEHSAIEGLPIMKGEEVKIDMANEEFEFLSKGLDATLGKELEVGESLEFEARPSDSHRRLLEFLLDHYAKDGHQYGGLNRESHAGQVKWFCEEHRDKKPEMGSV